MACYKPELKQYNDHWVVTDCQGNAVGFDYDYQSAHMFLIGEISEYIAHDFSNKLGEVEIAGSLWTWPSPGMCFENKWTGE